MAFVHSKKTRVLVDDKHLSAFLTEAGQEYSGAVEDSTTFIDTARAYIPGLGDGSASLAGLFDGDAGAVHDAFKDLKGTHSPVPYSYGPEGFAVGNPAELAHLLNVSYQVGASVASITEVSVGGQADGGVDSGISLADLVARTASADGTSVDNGASSEAGAVGHLHVVTVSGTSPTLDVTIQHSVDAVAWVDLITFTQATASTSERVEVSGTVNRHLRATWTVGGTDPSFEFAVTVARR